MLRTALLTAACLASTAAFAGMIPVPAGISYCGDNRYADANAIYTEDFVCKPTNGPAVLGEPFQVVCAHADEPEMKTEPGNVTLLKGGNDGFILIDETGYKTTLKPCT